MRSIFIFLTILISGINISGQEKKKFKDIFSVSGYVKYMNTSSFASLDSVITDNLIHNRIRFKAFISDHFTAVVGLENVVVVQTDDATLVVHKEKVEEIKTLIEKLVDTEYKVLL